MTSKFNKVITVFKTFRRQISTLYTKYYESPFEKLRVWKTDIMIIKLSKNNSNKSSNEYYNLESIFKKCIRESFNKSLEKDRKTNYFLYFFFILQHNLLLTFPSVSPTFLSRPKSRISESPQNRHLFGRWPRSTWTVVRWAIFSILEIKNITGGQIRRIRCML